jgi:hypothetical protein
MFFGINYFENIIDNLIEQCHDVNVFTKLCTKSSDLIQHNASVTSNQFIQQNSVDLFNVGHLANNSLLCVSNQNTSLGVNCVKTKVSKFNNQLSSLPIQGDSVKSSNNTINYFDSGRSNKQLPLFTEGCYDINYVYNSFVDSSGDGNYNVYACPHIPNGVLVDENVYNYSGFVQGLPTGHPLFSDNSSINFPYLDFNVNDILLLIQFRRLPNNVDDCDVCNSLIFHNIHVIHHLFGYLPKSPLNINFNCV